MTENVKVNYIYADAEEKYVKAVVLYVDVDGTLFYDQACNHLVNGADVLNFFLKGLILCSGSNESEEFMNPVHLKVKQNIVEVIYIDEDVYATATASIRN